MIKPANQRRKAKNGDVQRGSSDAIWSPVAREKPTNGQLLRLVGVCAVLIVWTGYLMWVAFGG